MKIEIRPAQSPLKPGETGMHTNGPPRFWYSINDSEWMPCHPRMRSVYKLKQELLLILEEYHD